MNLFIKTTKNKNGKTTESIWVNFTMDGKRYRKSLKMKYTNANYKRAEKEILPTLQYKLLNGEMKKENKYIPTIDEFIDYSFELHRGMRNKNTEYGHKKNYENYIKDIFGNKRLDKVNSNEITLWQNKLQKESRLSKAYIKKIRGILYSLFEDAIKKEYISNNPVKGVKGLRETENPKVKRIKLMPFKINEIKKLLDISKGQNKNLLATLFFTGMRCGETIGLKWDCIDFENKKIYVQNQIVRGEFKHILKTSNSNRVIPIIDTLLPYLKSQFELTGHLNSFVFLTEKSKKHYFSANRIREQIWVKLFNNIDIPYRNLHQTRGTFISTLISSGEDINYVSKIAGHENVNITLEKYSHYIPAPNNNFGKCFERILAKDGTKLTPKEIKDS